MITIEQDYAKPASLVILAVITLERLRDPVKLPPNMVETTTKLAKLYTFATFLHLRETKRSVKDLPEQEIAQLAGCFLLSVSDLPPDKFSSSTSSMEWQAIRLAMKGLANKITEKDPIVTIDIEPALTAFSEDGPLINDFRTFSNDVHDQFANYCESPNNPNMAPRGTNPANN